MPNKIKEIISAIKIKSNYFISRNIIKNNVEKAIFYAHGRENLGDSMVPWLIECISGKKYSYSNPSENLGLHLMSIGSIMQLAHKDSVVWGSGFISAESRLKMKPQNVFACRGPLTHEKLKKCSVSSPLIFGDPALLTSKYVKVNRVNNSNLRIGVIPHYVDFDLAKKIISSNEKKYKNFIIIDIQTSDIISFCEKISQCDVIISSSLHGIILAESFGIPAIWCIMSDKVYGGSFKFIDYLKGTNRDAQPIKIEDINENNIRKNLINPIKNLQDIQDNLLNSFPDSFR